MKRKRFTEERIIAMLLVWSVYLELFPRSCRNHTRSKILIYATGKLEAG